MMIQHQLPPDESVRALREAADTLHPAHGQMVAMLRELSERPQDHQPHPVYVVGLADMAGDAGLSKASILGWRYLAQSDQARNYSFVVHQDAGGASHRFAEMNRGLFVEGTLNIISDSQLQAKLDQGTYDLSVLMIHALGLFALWLRAKDAARDLIAMVPPAPSYLEAWPKLYSLEDFQNAVKPEAIRKLAVARTSFV
jgi:hypothetical protein